MNSQAIEKLMVLKDEAELPPSMLKHLRDYSPNPKEQVIVLSQEQEGNEVFLMVRFNRNGKQINRCSLSARHFRTVQAHKLREKLLKLPIPRAANIEKLLKTL